MTCRSRRPGRLIDRYGCGSEVVSRTVEISVIAVDVGSLPNIGWWRATKADAGSGGGSLDELVDAIVADFNSGVRVAVGFEAPLFVPMPSEAADLNRQRLGEKGRPWCVGAGSGALALGVQQASYVFAALARKISPRVTFAPDELVSGDADLLVWEAFVSGKAKDRSADNRHIDDARRAVEEFLRRLAQGDVSTDVHDT
jgi:hypothetical protein